MGPSIMYMETWDWPWGMLGLEFEELLLLQAKKTSMAMAPLAAASHFVTVFMLCSFIGRDTPSSGKELPKTVPKTRYRSVKKAGRAEIGRAPFSGKIFFEDTVNFARASSPLVAFRMLISSLKHPFTKN